MEHSSSMRFRPNNQPAMENTPTIGPKRKIRPSPFKKEPMAPKTPEKPKRPSVFKTPQAPAPKTYEPPERSDRTPEKEDVNKNRTYILDQNIRQIEKDQDAEKIRMEKDKEKNMGDSVTKRHQKNLERLEDKRNKLKDRLVNLRRSSISDYIRELAQYIQ